MACVTAFAGRLSQLIWQQGQPAAS